MTVQVFSYFGSFTRESRLKGHYFNCVSRLTNSINYRDREDAEEYVRKMKETFPTSEYEIVVTNLEQ